MQKEERITIILLAMASLSLVIAYFTFLPSAEYQEYSKDVGIGSYVQTSGIITQKYTTKTGEHLIIYLKNENVDQLMVFIPGGAEIGASLNRGDLVFVKGKVCEYNGKREIVVEDKSCLTKQ
ncbi:MAG: hypothetical protein GIS02_05825 [Methanosarcinales archaeon]|uniref:Nucleotide-binding protein n=1 Tax=Candidatus Ethanoperedens thermophilum TaxID=2766897 RepID=A0A848DBW1_9EURY|nr:hypothetical protein [Candidatus Ethanoperedens thermophilum]